MSDVQLVETGVAIGMLMTSVFFYVTLVYFKVTDDKPDDFIPPKYTDDQIIHARFWLENYEKYPTKQWSTIQDRKDLFSKVSLYRMIALYDLSEDKRKNDLEHRIEYAENHATNPMGNRISDFFDFGQVQSGGVGNKQVSPDDDSVIEQTQIGGVGNSQEIK